MEVIGIDLGGTKIALGLVNMEGKLLHAISFHTQPERGPAFIQRDIFEAIQSLQKLSSHLVGIGIGVAGQIDHQEGIVRSSPNLPGWNDIPLKKNLEEALNLPVYILNDVRAITFGEWKFGQGRNCSDLVCVFVGTGIGGGVISANRLLVGATDTFSEIGHMVVELNGPKCTCGRSGCWEALAGGWGIAKRAQLILEKSPSSSSYLLESCHGDLRLLSTKKIIEAYKSGDPFSIRLILDVQNTLCIGFTNLVHLYNPKIFVIGGGVIEGMNEMYLLIEDYINKHALQVAVKNLKVTKPSFEKNAGIMGAAAAFFHYAEI